jgi:hypothetical protein
VLVVGRPHFVASERRTLVIATAFLATALAVRLGRRLTLVLASAAFGLGAMIMVGAPGFGMLVVGLALVGIGRVITTVVGLSLEAIGHRPAFGLNWDPSHFVWQDLDPVGFLWDFRDLIYHVDCKDAKRQVGNGRNGRLGSHLPWADPRRGWDFVSTGRGDVPWEACFRIRCGVQLGRLISRAH